jgi:hypothetical protein
MTVDADNTRLAYSADENAGFPDEPCRKYIVDIVGGMRLIVTELDGSTVEKCDIYANGQIANLFGKTQP